jgi:hypothetical protein
LTVVLVTLLACGLRWYYVTTTLVVEPIRGDAIQYFSYAWNLVHHGIYAGNHPGSPVIEPSNFRDPGYPLFLALWMKLFGNQSTWYAVVLLAQAVLGTLTIPLTMQIGRRWLNRRWAAGAGILLAVWPHNIAITSNLLSETLFGFLCAVAVLVCVMACERRRAGWAVAAGLCFGAAALTNAVLLPFGILLALFLGWRRLIPRRIMVALCVGVLLLPGAWAIRNLRTPTPATGQTSTDRALMNLVQGSWPAYHSAWQKVIVQHNAAGKPTLDAIGAEYNLLLTSPQAGIHAIVQRLSQHPWDSLAWYTLRKPWVLWDWRIRIGQNDIYVFPVFKSPFDTQPVMRALEAICHTINPLLAALALMCLIVAVVGFLRRAHPPAHGGAALDTVLLLLAYITFVYSILQTDPRYSIPFRSFEMLAAMTTCSLVAGWIVKIRREHADPIRKPGVTVVGPDAKGR